MYGSAFQLLANERIERLRAEASHDALVRTCLLRAKEQANATAAREGRARRWLPWARSSPSPAFDRL